MFSINDSLPLDIAGYDHFLPQRFSGDPSAKLDPQTGTADVSWTFGDSLRTMTLQFGDSLSGFDSVRLDIGAFADSLLRDHGDVDFKEFSRMPPAAMSLAVEQSGRKVKLFFRHLHLIRREGNMTISSYTIDIAYTDRK